MHVYVLEICIIMAHIIAIILTLNRHHPMATSHGNKCMHRKKFCSSLNLKTIVLNNKKCRCVLQKTFMLNFMK